MLCMFSLCFLTHRILSLFSIRTKLTAQGGSCHRGNTVWKNVQVYMKSSWAKRAGKSLGFKKDKKKPSSPSAVLLTRYRSSQVKSTSQVSLVFRRSACEPPFSYRHLEMGLAVVF